MVKARCCYCGWRDGHPPECRAVDPEESESMTEHPNLEAIKQAYEDAREDFARARARFREAEAAMTYAEEQLSFRQKAYAEALLAETNGH